MDALKIEPLTPARATEQIRAKVGPDLTVKLTGHAKEQMLDRGLIMGDIIYVLRYGFVYDEAETATREEFFKYRMESSTPNSGGRVVIVVVIPSPTSVVKIVTIMWKDELLG